MHFGFFRTVRTGWTMMGRCNGKNFSFAQHSDSLADGNTPHERRFCEHFAGLFYHLKKGWVSSHNCERQSEALSMQQECLPILFFWRCAFFWGEEAGRQTYPEPTQKNYKKRTLQRLMWNETMRKKLSSWKKGKWNDKVSGSKVRCLITVGAKRIVSSITWTCTRDARMKVLIRFAHSSCTLRCPGNVSAHDLEYVLLFFFSSTIDKSIILFTCLCCIRQKFPFIVLVATKHRKIGACSWLPGLVQKGQARASWSTSWKLFDTTRKKTPGQNTLHLGAAVNYCAIRLIRRPDQPCINALRQTQWRENRPGHHETRWAETQLHRRRRFKDQMNNSGGAPLWPSTWMEPMRSALSSCAQQIQRTRTCHLWHWRTHLQMLTWRPMRLRKEVLWIPLASQAERLTWNSASAKRKRSAPNVMIFSSGST